jgi:hypothetical protein
VKNGLLYKAIDALNIWANPDVRDNQGTALIQGKPKKFTNFNSISF